LRDGIGVLLFVLTLLEPWIKEKEKKRQEKPEKRPRKEKRRPSY